MASTLPPLLIQLVADVSQLKTGLAQAQAAIKGVDDNVKKASGGMSNFVGKLKQVGAAMGATFAASQVAAFAKESIMAASNMAESLSKVQVVFGEGAAEVGDGLPVGIGLGPVGKPVVEESRLRCLVSHTDRVPCQGCGVTRFGRSSHHAATIAAAGTTAISRLVSWMAVSQLSVASDTTHRA